MGVKQVVEEQASVEIAREIWLRLDYSGRSDLRSVCGEGPGASIVLLSKCG